MKRADRDARWGGRFLGTLLAALALAVFLVPAAGAQPFESWLTMTGGATSGFVLIPGPSLALSPTGAFTIEAWVAITNSTVAEDCRSIAGKDFIQAWWIGQCTVSGQPVLRSYLKGGGSAKNGGVIPRGVWTHVAVTFDGATRRHYINGELAASFAEAGPLPASSADMRIGSDVSWEHTPTGSIDEVRLWNVARTTSQIRSAINVRITSPQPGLVGLWSFDGGASDIVGGHGGALSGSGIGFFTFAAGPTSCGASTTAALCLQTRFQITTKWRTNPTPGTPTDGDGHVVVAGPNSGIFWFFSSDNWEVMVKAINGCGLNSRYWIYSAATTDQFYRMEVFDFKGLKNKIYFNYPGSPAPALTDSSAFATCP
jgi:hypothetical protein